MNKLTKTSGNKTTLTYASGKLTKVENACGALNFTYSGNLISKITDNTGRTVEYGYTDGNGNLTSFKDVEGNIYIYIYIYDNQNRIYEKDYINGTEKTTFDAQNQVTSVTDRNGNGNTYFYEHEIQNKE